MTLLAAVLLATLTADARLHGRTLRAVPGTVVVVQLEAQMGTGYGWQVQSLAKNLEPMGKPELRRNEDGGVTGGSETQVFRFRVRSRGKSTLRMINVRPWVKNDKPRKTFRITIDSR